MLYFLSDCREYKYIFIQKFIPREINILTVFLYIFLKEKCYLYYSCLFIAMKNYLLQKIYLSWGKSIDK